MVAVYRQPLRPPSRPASPVTPSLRDSIDALTITGTDYLWYEGSPGEASFFEDIIPNERALADLGAVKFTRCDAEGTGFEAKLARRPGMFLFPARKRWEVRRPRFPGNSRSDLCRYGGTRPIPLPIPVSVLPPLYLDLRSSSCLTSSTSTD